MDRMRRDAFRLLKAGDEVEYMSGLGTYRVEASAVVLCEPNFQGIPVVEVQLSTIHYIGTDVTDFSEGREVTAVRGEIFPTVGNNYKCFTAKAFGSVNDRQMDAFALATVRIDTLAQLDEFLAQHDKCYLSFETMYGGEKVTGAECRSRLEMHKEKLG